MSTEIKLPSPGHLRPGEYSEARLINFTRIEGTRAEREALPLWKRARSCYDEVLRRVDLLEILRLALDRLFETYTVENEEGVGMHNLFRAQLDHLEKSMEALGSELSTVAQKLEWLAEDTKDSQSHEGGADARGGGQGHPPASHRAPPWPATAPAGH